MEAEKLSHKPKASRQESSLRTSDSTRPICWSLFDYLMISDREGIDNVQLAYLAWKCI